MEFQDYFNNPITLTVFILAVAAGLHHFSGVIVASIVQRVLRPHGLETKADNDKRKDTLRNVFSATARLVIWLVAIATILGVFNFNLGAIATGAGFLGIIIGLGAQATIRDYLAGISILIENQYRVGDIVTLSGGTIGGMGTSGLVEEISLRITKLRDLDGTLNIIRNGEASVITNRTYEYSSVVLDVGVAYDSDIDVVEKVMNTVGKAMQKDELLGDKISEPIAFLRVDQFAASSIMIRAVGKVVPAAQWEIAGEYRRRLLKAFTKEGIEIALPQVIVHQKT
ncbi:mechanosensitive ion channel family protein [Candidatus Saccharibacteria bacterium]|nr:mechanosensitive ion channel family protein [Candidatus Saccharibacteria bacterium]